MAMSENTVRVLEYLKANHGKDVTAADVAAELGIPKKTVEVYVVSLLHEHDTPNLGPSTQPAMEARVAHHR